MEPKISEKAWNLMNERTKAQNEQDWDKALKINKEIKKQVALDRQNHMLEKLTEIVVIYGLSGFGCPNWLRKHVCF